MLKLAERFEKSANIDTFQSKLEGLGSYYLEGVAEDIQELLRFYNDFFPKEYAVLRATLDTHLELIKDQVSKSHGGSEQKAKEILKSLER